MQSILCLCAMSMAMVLAPCIVVVAVFVVMVVITMPALSVLFHRHRRRSFAPLNLHDLRVHRVMDRVTSIQKRLFLELDGQIPLAADSKAHLENIDELR